MTSTSRIGTAVAAGYFLGRFKKLRLALMVGSALANKNVRSHGIGLLQQGTQGLTSSPEAKKLGEEISGKLVDAGKAAAVTAAAARIDSLSDKLNERSTELRELADADRADSGEEPEHEAEPDGEYDEEPDDEPAGEEPEAQSDDEYDEEPESQADPELDDESDEPRKPAAEADEPEDEPADEEDEDQQEARSADDGGDGRRKSARESRSGEASRKKTRPDGRVPEPRQKPSKRRSRAAAPGKD